MTQTNDLGQPVGDLLPAWTPPPVPPHAAMEGRRVALEPLSASRHGEALWDAARLSKDEDWTYLPVGPFREEAAFRAQLETQERSEDPMYFAIVSHETRRAEGFCSFLRIAPAAGSIEVGFIWMGPRLQRTPAATEAMFLMMRRIFDLGYRRYEWKCDACNAPSRRAAARLGFSYEGIFRQAVVVKGRNRDTAWYAMIDAEQPRLREAYEAWLSDDNFDETGRQRRSLSELTAPVLVARG